MLSDRDRRTASVRSKVACQRRSCDVDFGPAQATIDADSINMLVNASTQRQENADRTYHPSTVVWRTNNASSCVRRLLRPTWCIVDRHPSSPRGAVLVICQLISTTPLETLANVHLDSIERFQEGSEN